MHPGRSAPHPPPSPAGDGELIKRLRSHVDLVDQQICELVQRRTAMANEIGSIRRSLGGPRIEPDREEEVVRHYANLGASGRRLAEVLLELGRVPDIRQRQSQEADSQ